MLTEKHRKSEVSSVGRYLTNYWWNKRQCIRSWSDAKEPTVLRSLDNWETLILCNNKVLVPRYMAHPFVSLLFLAREPNEGNDSLLAT
jgi:hypothetical protein